MFYQGNKSNIEPNITQMFHVFQGNMPDDNLEVCDIVEARRIMELSMVGIVIERIEETDQEELLKLITQMDKALEDGELFAKLDERFHTRLMGCGKNQVLLAFIGTLNEMIDRNVLKKDYNIRINAQKEHKNIMYAVMEKDARKLKEAMNAHLLCFKSLYF
jgi:DNA-binding FadR family transcriptional regulator